MRPLLLVAALLAAPALAQAPADTLDLVPGDGALATAWLAPGTRTYTIRVVQPMQQDVGTVTETTTLADGRVTRVSVVSIPMQGMTQTDSLVADAATLAPSAHVSTGGPSDASLEFLAEGVVGLLTPRTGEAKTVALMTDAPVFDAAWLGEVAQSLPLEPGLVARAEAYVTQSPDETVVAVLTVGEPDAEGVVPVAVVMGPMTMTHRVDPATRALRSMRFSPQPGLVIEIAPDAE